MHSGPVIVGFDGTTAAEQALRESAALLAPCAALVVVVWEPGRAFELMTLPTLALETAGATLDVRAAFAAEADAYEKAQQLAEQGAAHAAALGFKAQGLAVADDVTVADTLVRIAAEQDSRALVVGSHGRRGLTAALLGSTSRGIVERAGCPVLIVRSGTGGANSDGGGTDR